MRQTQVHQLAFSNKSSPVLCSDNDNAHLGCFPKFSDEKIKIVWPANNSQVTTGSLTIYGTLAGSNSSLGTSAIQLTLDGTPIDIVPDLNIRDGYWSSPLTILPGKHTIGALASQAVGPPSFYSISISAASDDVDHAKLRIYIPMYSLSTLSSFLNVMKSYGPSLPYIVAINPNSGPGTTVDSSFTNAITTLHNSGLNVSVIGYVPTGYGSSRTVANVEGMIDTWHSLYPNIDGIMFDEVGNTASSDSFYKTITDYARAHGAHFIRGNPGAPIDAGKMSMFDMIAIGESSSYPSASALQSDTFNGAYSKDKFAFTIHDQPTLDTTWIATAKQYLGYVYITNDVEPNPYDTVPSYFVQELQALQAG